MPGPMSIPNGNNEIVNVIVGYDDGKPVYRKVAMQALTGEQRAALAARRKLDTGKTRKNHERK